MDESSASPPGILCFLARTVAGFWQPIRMDIRYMNASGGPTPQALWFYSVLESG
ncbi:MAG: hypothetical protein Q8L74_09745 [Nitrospirota bacterium]|nr:hypothetical protein [Nitrospirota bacterium]MDP2383500.1 hypothetical protein [Nitrospirota bacterium]MDP3597355.1 hypothetical protein [Nitrospirota bacterium]